MEKSSVLADAAARARSAVQNNKERMSAGPKARYPLSAPVPNPHPLLRGLTFHRVRYHVRSLKEDYRIGKLKEFSFIRARRNERKVARSKRE